MSAFSKNRFLNPDRDGAKHYTSDDKIVIPIHKEYQLLHQLVISTQYKNKKPRFTRASGLASTDTNHPLLIYS